MRKVRHGGNNFIGWFPANKMERMVAYESLLERDFIYHLDFEPCILKFEEQPFSIPIKVQGKDRTYTPDFFITTSNRKFLVEVKPEKYVNSSRNQSKYLVATDYCSRRGWEFLVFTEVEIRQNYRLENIKLLTQFARYPANIPLEAKIITTLHALPSNTTIIDFIEMLHGLHPNEVIVTLLKLAYFHKIYLSIDSAPISFDSSISAAHGELSRSEWKLMKLKTENENDYNAIQNRG